MSPVSGLLYQYYHICPRKMWFAANGISMESENESVQIGHLIDSNSYDRERKHILIDETASVDFMRGSTVFEVKKSSAEKAAAIAQIKYYLYVLHQKGVESDGELRIPKEYRIEKVCLTEEDLAHISKTVQEIEAIIVHPQVPAIPAKTRICKKCAFYELCYV